MKKVLGALALGLVIGFGMVSAKPALAGSEIGFVKATEGAVTVVRDGAPLTLSVGDGLMLSDTIVTGADGPSGEVAELKIAHFALQIVEPGPDVVWLEGGLDLVLGMDLAFLPEGSGLDISIGEPDAADVSLTILDNPLGVNAAHVESVLPGVITPLIPDLAGALSGFPLPQFFGLSIDGVEVSRNGEFLSLFANLSAGP